MKHIHFIGICGVAMSALALAFKRQGPAKDGASWKVTGSDVGFYPPISTYLKENKIDFYSGWHPERVDKPNLVVVGNVASSTNPEWLYVQKHKLNYKSYPEVIAEHIIKKKSIVCAGTYGKSTCAALLTYILKQAGFNPSYMFGGLMVIPPFQPPPPAGSRFAAGGRTQGGLPLATPRHGRQTSPQPSPSKGEEDNSFPSAAITESTWSVVEGDEYKSSRWDMRPKFTHYSPTHLLLTSVVWDHADVFPTEKKYTEAFKNLVDSVSKSGLVVISEKALPLLFQGGARGGLPSSETLLPQRTATPSMLPLSKGEKFVTYGKNSDNDYLYTNIIQTKNGLEFDIIAKEKTYHVKTSCLGEYMAENICGCFALAHQIGIEPQKIIDAIAGFQGMKRRLEKRYEGKITIFDDIAHSPLKAKYVLENLRQLYCHCEDPDVTSGDETIPPKQGDRRGRLRRPRDDRPRLYAVFEPNTGNRQHEAIPAYDGAFSAASEVIIPRLTKIKINGDAIEGPELAHIISRTQPAVKYIEDDEKLVDYLKQKIQPADIVVFLGSHGFRGMIEQLVGRVSKVSL